MSNPDGKNPDPRQLAGVGRHLAAALPGNVPVGMPVAMPGSPGSAYNRYREMTLEEMLLENRVLFLVGEINHVSASRIMMQMLYLQSVKRDQDINLYINSPGGVVDDTLAIYDIMRFLTCDIATYCIGRAESGGAIVFMAGKKGKRFILPNAKVMIHQPFGGVYGQAADIQIQADEILKTKETLISIMAQLHRPGHRAHPRGQRARSVLRRAAGGEVRHLRRGPGRRFGRRHRRQQRDPAKIILRPRSRAIACFTSRSIIPRFPARTWPPRSAGIASTWV